MERQSKVAAVTDKAASDNNDEKGFPKTDFPWFMHNFVNEASKEYPEIVSWSSNGAYFKIQHDDKEKLQDILTQYFQHGRYDSLRRQLNAYGFFKEPAGKFQGMWHRTHFHRDHPEKLHFIKPRPDYGRRAKKEAKEQARRAAARKGAASTATASPPTANSSNNLRTSTRSSKLRQTEPTVAKRPPKLQSPSPSSTTARPSRKKKRIIRTRSPNDFPKVLYRFVQSVDDEIARWDSTGTGILFELHHPKLPQVLEQYFQHPNYKFISLRRQLNVYGFLKDSGYFRHPHFRRDDPDSLSKIVKVYHQSNTSYVKKDKPSASSKGGSHDNRADEVASESSNDQFEVDDDEDGSEDGDDDDDSTLVDYDLSTYATMETEQQSDVERANHTDEKSEKSAEQDQDENPQPKPKFQIHQRVYARDKDGVMYEAVVRRRLFGPTYHKQVEMGLVTSKQEAEEALAERDLQPIWHYFVHFNNWNVRFDRFVSEHDVYEITDEVKTYAEELMKVHKGLQAEMRKPATKNKKSWQTIDGAAFLREWKKRRARVERELNWEGCNSADSTQGDGPIDSKIAKASSSNQKNEHTKNNTWTKAALALELKLREKSLSTKRSQSIANAIVLPFALKKVMVEQWEIISQCKSLPSLPAAITIRQALDKYLESKNAVVISENAESKSERDAVAVLNPDSSKEDVESKESPVPMHNDLSSENMESKDGEDSEMEARKQEWRDMANGIAMLFDEALDSWLLYKEELPQLRVIDNIPEYSMKPYSEIYGCEHLLRFFVRLPEMLTDQISDSEARPIFAKVNDFVRFLHKNNSTLFTQTHRKLNEAELKAQLKLEKAEERKRKALNEDNSIPIGNKKTRETQEAN